MSQLNLFSEQERQSTQILILNFGNEEIRFALKIRDELTGLKISSEIYPDTVKLKKQMSYADSRKIPYIIIAGEEEIKNNLVTLKIMASGEQKKMNIEELLSFFKATLKSEIH
jgi:histidyl-tRNA synthetase